MQLVGKTALITGGAVRIGRAITLALAKAGCNVFIHYGKSQDHAEQTRIEAESYGVKAITFSADLTDEDQTRSIIPSALEQFSMVSILVNNAGIFPDDDSFNNLNLNTWNEIFAINLRAAYILSHTFAKHLSATEHGKILNINDARIFRPGSEHLAYRLSKTSLYELTRILAKELAPVISVNTLALGAILPPPGKNDEYLQNLANERIPLLKTGSLEQVTDSVLFLLGNDFITGETIKIDGGEYL